MFDPNEASLVYFLHKYLLLLKVSISDENSFIILHKFPSPFKSHNLENLSKRNKRIRFPFVKCLDNQPKLDILQMLTKQDLRIRAEFVFIASTIFISKKVKNKMVLAINVLYLSSNFSICGVAIVAKVKTNSLLTSFATTKN